MDIKTWLIFLVTSFILALAPGPAVLCVSAQGMKYGPKSSYFGALGISSGNLMYFILSAAGLSALILEAGNLFFYIKLCGALYLIYTGGMIIYKSFKKSHAENIHIEAEQSNIKSFVQAFITQAANPKAILFFVALLPQFVNTKGNIFVQFSILAITTIFPETFILMGYGWLAAKSKKLAGKNSKFRKIQDRISGTILVSLGINLLFMESKR